jgi:RNA polymerase sigma factor (sigma-70 family)
MRFEYARTRIKKIKCGVLLILFSHLLSLVRMNAIEVGHARRSLEVPTQPRSRLDTGVLVNLLAPMLSSVAQRYESDAQSCSDLEQEMLIALWQSLSTFEGKVSLGKWMNSVVHRIGVQHLAARRASRRTERLSGKLGLMRDAEDPESILALRERAQAALDLVSGLTPREREVVWLHVQEFELDEMTCVMSICRTQVRETMIRARRRLMKRMKKAGLRCTPEFGAPDQPSDDELVFTHTARARARRRGQASVYFIEPSAKVNDHGSA